MHKKVRDQRTSRIIAKPKTLKQEQQVLKKSILQIDIEDNQNKVLDTISKNIEKKFKYQRIYKKRNPDEINENIKDLRQKLDPRVAYMKRCDHNLERNLPILDKIIDKTLCL